jgi:hypothetical protein
MTDHSKVQSSPRNKFKIDFNIKQFTLPIPFKRYQHRKA